MHLVHHQLVPRGHPKVVPFPVEVGVVDDRVAVRVGHLPGVGVDAPELARRRRQEVAVLVPLGGLGDLGIPVAVALPLHLVAAGVPGVEGADQGDFAGVRGPDAESHAIGLRNGAHAIDGAVVGNHVSVLEVKKRGLIL